MSFTVGQLMIEMAANVARIQTDMDASRRIVDSAATSMAGSMRRVEAVIGAALGSAAVGAAATFGRSLYEASARAERLRVSLDFASAGNGAQSLAYVSEVAMRLGLDLNSTAQAYASFASAARGTSLQGAQTKLVFESIAKASAVMGLSTDDTKGVLQALQQMLSKGTVSAEELKGQLGERLPIALGAAAKALGVTTAELNKMLEQGQIISADFLPRFAKQIESELGTSVEEAAGRLDASVNRMNNAWERLKQSVGDSGVSKGMSVAAEAVTNDMQAIADSIEMAKGTGNGFFGQMYNGAMMISGRAMGLQAFSDSFLPLSDRIKSADERLAALRAKAAEGWGVNIYFKADLASARAEVEALQALQIAMGQKVAGAGRGDADAELAGRREQYTTADPYAGAKALDDVRKGAKLRTDIQREEGAKAVEIAKAYGKAIADAGENPAYATALAAERDARLIALRRETHAQLEAFDKSHSQRTSAEQKKQLSDFAQIQKKVLDDMAKDSASAQAELLGLGRAQEQFLALAGSPEWAKLNNAQRATVAGLYEERIAREQANNGVRAGIELRQELARLALDEVDSISARITNLRDETDRMGLTVLQLGALEVARTEEAIANAEATLAIKIAAGARGEEIEAVTLLVEQLRELRKVQLENTAKKAAAATATEWEKASDRIEKSLTDALFRAFESGKSFSDALKSTLINAFKTMVLEPTIRATLSGFGSGSGGNPLQSMMQMSGGGGGGGSGGFGQLMQLAQLGNAMLTGGIASGIGGSLASLASLTGSTTLGSFAAGMQGATLAPGLAGPTTAGATGAMGWGSMAGTAAGYLGGAAIGVYGGRAISGGYSVSGNSGNAAVNVGTAIGAIVGGPIGAAIGGAIGGLANRAFGRKARETTEAGIDGQFGGGSFSGQAFNAWLEKGGWFRSDRSGTDYTAVDTSSAAALTTAAGATLAQAQVWAEALNLPAEQLAAVTSKFKVTLGTDAKANETAIAGAVAAYQDKLTDLFAGSLRPFVRAGETLTQTFGRLAVLQTFSSHLNDLGGVFGRVASLTLSAREHFIGLAGGMEALAAQSQAFAQNYFSREEIAGLKATEIQAALQAAGLDTSNLSSRADYRTLVESLNVSTVEGREQLALLLKLQGDFAQVGDYLSETGQSLAAAAAQAPATSVLANLLSGTQAEQQSQKQVDATLTVAAKVDGLTGLMQQTVNLLSQMSSSGSSMVGANRPAWEVNA